MQNVTLGVEGLWGERVDISGAKAQESASVQRAGQILGEAEKVPVATRCAPRESPTHLRVH